jgi:hypothetical protein
LVRLFLWRLLRPWLLLDLLHPLDLSLLLLRLPLSGLLPPLVRLLLWPLSLR